MRKYLNKNFLSVAVLSFVASLIGYFVLLFSLRRSVAFTTRTVYPISDWNVFLFFSKYLFILVPFVVSFTFLGSYLISRNWAKEVTIKTVIHENNGAFEKKSTITFFSEDEKKLFKIMMNTDGDIYQNDLTIKSGLPRYQISRIVSRFENYGIIEKERFGMTNLIRLKLGHVEFD